MEEENGLMSVSGSLKKQSVSRNMRVSLVDAVICSICLKEEKNRMGVERRDKGLVVVGSTIAHRIHTRAGSSNVACLEVEA